MCATSNKDTRSTEARLIRERMSTSQAKGSVRRKNEEAYLTPLQHIQPRKGGVVSNDQKNTRVCQHNQTTTDRIYSVPSFPRDTAITAQVSECHLWVGSESPSQVELWRDLAAYAEKEAAHDRCPWWTYILRSVTGVRCQSLICRRTS